VLKNGSQALKNRLQVLKNGLQVLKNRLQALKNGLQQLKNRLQWLRNRLPFPFQACPVFRDAAGSSTARFREMKRGGGLVVYFAAPGSSLLGVKRNFVVFKKKNRYWYKELPFNT
jgi:hypothetical protein